MTARQQYQFSVLVTSEVYFSGYTVLGRLVILGVFLDNTSPVFEHCQGADGSAGRHVQEDEYHVPEHCKVFCIRSEEIYDGRIFQRPKGVY